MDDTRYPVSIDLGRPESAPPPEPPPSGPVVWLKENLFSSWFNGVLSVLTILLLLFVVRGVSGWAIEETRQWRAVAANSRLLMVQAYPAEEFWRVWLSVGIVVVLSALSLAAWRTGGMMSWDRLGRIVQGITGSVAVVLLISAGTWGIGRIITLVVSVLVFLGMRQYVKMLGDSAKEDTIPTMALLGVAVALLIGFLWVMKAPVPGISEEGFNTDDWQPIASSTKVPWTIMGGIAVAAYLVGVAIRDRIGWMRGALVGTWVLSSPFIVMIILRGPDIDWRETLTFDLPVFLGFSILGGALLAWLANPSSGEPGRFVAGVVFVTGLVLLVFVDMFMIYKVSVLTLGIYALLAPTFGGSPASRNRYIVGWVVGMFLITVAFRMGDSGSGLGFSGADFLGGLTLTFVLAIFGIALSFPLGVVLALGRTSTMPIFRSVSTVYIELVRSVPLITWLFASANLFQLFIPGRLEVNGIIRAIGAIILFSAAYLAENVRGGLQSISKGQYEAADALGMTTVQKTSFIVLPQALKAVIPALVGQVIALFKDTSLVAIIGLFDLLYIAQRVIPNQSLFLGSFMESIVAAAVIYWVFTFMFSRASMRLERRLGLGTR